MLVFGLVVNSLTFYSGLAINGPQSEWQDSKLAALIFLTCITLPFIVFLWWITFGRMVAQAVVGLGGHRRTAISVLTTSIH